MTETTKWDPKVYAFMPAYSYRMSEFPTIMRYAFQHYDCLLLSDMCPDNKLKTAVSGNIDDNDKSPLKTIVTGNYTLYVPYKIVSDVNGSLRIRSSWVAVDVR